MVKEINPKKTDIESKNMWIASDIIPRELDDCPQENSNIENPRFSLFREHQNKHDFTIEIWLHY